MKSTVIISSPWFFTFTFLFSYFEGIYSCDTKWIRLVYMMSCGKMKRESRWLQNNTFFENVPDDFEGAFKYFMYKDPLNPVLKNETALREIFNEEKNLTEETVKKFLEEEYSRKKLLVKEKSVLFNKLIPTREKKNHNSGIQGFPMEWKIEETLDKKVTRRGELERLIEECCKVPPVKTCNASTFSGACK